MIYCCLATNLFVAKYLRLIYFNLSVGIVLSLYKNPS